MRQGTGSHREVIHYLGSYRRQSPPDETWGGGLGERQAGKVGRVGQVLWGYTSMELSREKGQAGLLSEVGSTGPQNNTNISSNGHGWRCPAERFEATGTGQMQEHYLNDCT